MPRRVIAPLTARAVATKPEGIYGDGNGLFLVVAGSGARHWQVRYQLAGQSRRAIGLGAVDRPHSLAEARERARDIQRQAKLGIDPLAEKQREREAAAPVASFRFCAEQYIESRQATWKNERHTKEWSVSLTRYAYPVLGDMPVQNISVRDVLAVLQPIWLVKPVTASRVRNRIEAVLGWAIVLGHRLAGDNPARWVKHLENVLPSPVRANDAVRREAGRKEHYLALPWQEMPALMVRLAAQQSTTARALEFTILTAARTDQARAATWDEINLAERVWTVPGYRMKAGREHRVPLPAAAMAILAGQKEYCEYIKSPFVFPGAVPNRPIHSNTMYALLVKYMKVDGITVHGFRSTFRQWVADATRFPPHVAEMALAHALGKVEAAYQQSDLLEERRLLAAAWARYIAGDSSVVELPVRAA